MAILSKKSTKKDISRTLESAGKEVLDYLGTEFFYHEKGKDIYAKAVGVELTLNGLGFHSASHPIRYKGHRIKEYDYDYIFPGGEAAKVFIYKKDEEIDSQIDELEAFNKRFGIKKGFVLAIPEKEEMVVVVKEV